jgi:hypothetical protein
MAILVFVLGAILLAAGAVSAYQSLDLLPTGLGTLYAISGAIGVCSAVITFALGVAIWRLGKLARLIKAALPSVAGPPIGEEATARQAPPRVEPAFEEPIVTVAEAPASLDQPPAPEEESPININRVGHLPSLEAIETALETPSEPPSLVGRYSSQGANYKIFDNGSIEAETSEGTFKFASMDEFKRHLIETKKAQAPPATE